MIKKMLLIVLTLVTAYLVAANIAWLTKEYMPRRVCMMKEQSLINSHIWADTIISVSYATLPIWLVMMVLKRKDLMQKGAYIIFACFILFCGLTHIMNIISIWHTYYRLDAVIKWCCAIASAGAAISLPFVVRAVIKAPSPKQFKNMAEELRLAREGIKEAIEKNGK